MLLKDCMFYAIDLGKLVEKADYNIQFEKIEKNPNHY